MTHYEISSKLDTIQYKYQNLSYIVEMMAADTTDNCMSGALWSVYDMMQHLTSELEIVSSDVMQHHIDTSGAKAKAKKKK